MTAGVTREYKDDNEDFDDEFDPDKHDQQMQQMFDDQYYNVDEGDQKPEFPYDEELDAGTKSTCFS